MLRNTLLLIAIVLLLAQFVQPSRATPKTDPKADLFVLRPAPADMQELVVGACYDCHSYRTEHPWYAYITPVNFLLQNNIEEGREALNFSRWDLYWDSEHASKCREEIAEGEMPPREYSFMHDHARLTAVERERMIAWFDADPSTAAHRAHAEGDDH